MKKLLVFPFFALFVAITGCDNSLDSLDEEKGFYSIYGSLDMNKNTNYVRVKDLNAPLTSAATKTLDVTVLFENMKSGSTQVMEDSVVKFDDVYTHNFRTTMAIEPSTRYRVTVHGPDGKSVHATATSPEIASTRVNPTEEDCRTPVTISFEPVGDVKLLRASLGFEYNKTMFWGRPTILGSTTNPDQVYIRFTPLNYINEVLDPRDEMETFWCHELSSELFEVEYRHFGPDFFDNTLSDTVNIPGGTGKLGAYYDNAFSFKIDTVNICFPNC